MMTRVVVTGGAGFVGSHLVDNLVQDGHHVTVFDAFVRRGSEYNASWLRARHPDERLTIVRGDVRDAQAVEKVVRSADVIYHVAGQVAVTLSVDDPRADFETNALGTLNVLEGARRSGRRPAVIFTSTNKVYGGMDGVATVEEGRRYRYRDLPLGIAESQPLDFHSPYGCSKGAADQYVRDYGRIYGLPTVVFRMSCIYGPRQLGTEDQGWVAHFVIAALTDQPITIYGDGKQVRDILFVSDLVRAFRLAVAHLDRTAGEVFNIGGGASNTMSVWAEFGEMLADLKSKRLEARFSDWRPGDQPCYVSDIRKAAELMGWRPLVDKETGIRQLWEWAASNLSLLEPIEAERSGAA
jgi:CDP-paratose 2-epimerase